MPGRAPACVSSPRLRLVFSGLAGLAFAMPVAAEKQTYRLDPVHTRVAFQVSHAGFSNPVATFSQVTGRLEFDPDDWTTGKVDVAIPLRTLDLGDADWNGKILDGTFFDAGKHPVARFVSTAVRPTGANTAEVTGTLTLRGVSQPVVLQVTLNQLKRHPLTFRRTSGFSARGTLSRAAFGMRAWKSVVGDTVTVIIEAEAQLDGDAEAPADAAPAAPTEPTTPAEESADAPDQP